MRLPAKPPCSASTIGAQEMQGIQIIAVRPMVPLYAARIEDLGPGDFVRVECIACGHDMLIPPSSLLHGLRLPPYTPVFDLEPRLRCRECDAKGKAVVSIRWAAS
jgi:hypothetical protein